MKYNCFKKHKHALLGLLIFLTSCKYEDGPSISLKSATARMKGTYSIDKFEVNNNDSLSVVLSRNCNGKIKIDDKSIIYGSLEFPSCKYEGRYDLRDGNRKIIIYFMGDPSQMIGIPPWEKQYSHTWDIVELKNKSLTFETTYNGNFIKIRLKQ